ncbi:MAG: hypothetical protein L3J45_07425 [Flavobacteriaceae bacterium]|nr:hypothetical protein [Flavobacteriaceae bacterium]
MFELQTVLDERRSTLDTLMTELLVSEIIEKEELYFDSDTLLNEALCHTFLSRFDKYYGVFIYKIKLADNKDIVKVKESFKKFQQSNKILRNIDKRNISKFNDTESDVLYVGIKSHKLKIRIKQHLGIGPSKSWALHLNHWIPRGVRFKMTIYQIDSENTEFVNFLEQGFWDRLNPMFGRRKEV